MKKTIQKLMAALLAVAMVCAMAIPAFADDTKENIQDHNSFSGFQIFKGDVEGNKISNADWGESITDHDKFLTDLKADTTIGGKFSNANNVQDILAVISTWHDSDDNSIAFARFVCKYLYPNANANPKPFAESNHSLTFSQAGYYLIVDTTYFSPGDSYHAYNSFMLKVTQANWVFDVTPKVEKPSVKKEVYDNHDGTSNKAGFGSSADHAINEPFQFKLTATLPASNARAYDYYDEYTVTFHDTLSEGITFDHWDTVVINNGGADITIPTGKYTCDVSGQNLTLSIDDVKTCVEDLEFNLNNGATITVTYTAHLNEKAYVNTAYGPTTTENKNSVYLQYSNNPRINTSLDRTPESEVYVFTYQLNNTKYKNSVADENKLKGAGFRLYSDAACNDTDEIKLKKNTTDGTYSRYFGDEAGEQMFSDDKGQFNVKGLDAGTYYLKETTTPTGFNTCPVTTVVIKANHTENNVDLTGSTINSESVGASGLSTTIVNKQGTTLPSTGGIGTTIFYVIGGGLMVAAIVLLVTKKRMENK